MEDESYELVAPAARRAWQRVLKIEEVGADDDFFELGGQSMSAMRIILMLRRELATNLDIKVLLNNPQFSDFVRCLTSYSRDAAPDGEPEAGTHDVA